MLNHDVESALNTSLYRVFRALARPVLRHKLPVRDVVELLKKAIVDVAAEEHGLDGRTTSTARIAVLTGLTRANVAKLQKTKPPYQAAAHSGSQHPINRIVAKWFRDEPWADESGPKKLAEKGSTNSFEQLAKSVGGDIAWQTLKGELQRSGCIEVEDGFVRLLDKAYINNSSSPRALQFLGEDVAALVHTIEHNLTTPRESRRFQRKAVFRELTPEGLTILQYLAEEHAQALLEKIDNSLSAHSLGLDEHNDNNRISGIGIYIFDHANPLGS